MKLVSSTSWQSLISLQLMMISDRAIKKEIPFNIFIFRVKNGQKRLLKKLLCEKSATSNADSFSRTFGLGMFAILVAFVFYQYKTDSLPLEEDDDDEDHVKITTMKSAVLVLLSGLVALAVGSELLVQGAVQTGSAIGVPEAVIGMTVVAFGTSLPELSTCIAAARKQSVGLILGNIIGSNTFNILSIVAFTAIVQPLAVDPVLLGMELWVTVAVTVLFAIYMMIVGRLTKPIGIAMMLAYVVFIAAQYLQ